MRGWLLVGWIFRGGPALFNKILVMLKTPWRRIKCFLVDGIGRGSSAIFNSMALLKVLWRKGWFLVDEIFRQIIRNHQTIHIKSHVREITILLCSMLQLFWIQPSHEEACLGSSCQCPQCGKKKFRNRVPGFLTFCSSGPAYAHCMHWTTPEQLVLHSHVQTIRGWASSYKINNFYFFEDSLRTSKLV